MFVSSVTLCMYVLLVDHCMTVLDCSLSRGFGWTIFCHVSVILFSKWKAWSVELRSGDWIGQWIISSLHWETLGKLLLYFFMSLSICSVKQHPVWLNLNRECTPIHFSIPYKLKKKTYLRSRIYAPNLTLWKQPEKKTHTGTVLSFMKIVCKVLYFVLLKASL